jgi:hypothetical protein
MQKIHKNKTSFSVILLRILSILAFCYFGFRFVESAFIDVSQTPIQEFSVISAEIVGASPRYYSGRFEIEYRNQTYSVRTDMKAYNNYVQKGNKPRLYYLQRKDIVFHRDSAKEFRVATIFSLFILIGSFALPNKKDLKKEKEEYDKKNEIYKDLNFDV